MSRTSTKARRKAGRAPTPPRHAPRVQDAAAAAAPAAVAAPLAPTQRVMQELAARYTGETSLEGMKEQARLYASSGAVVPRRYRNSPGDCYAIMSVAQSLDIHPMTAMKHLFFGEDGLSGMRGELMLVLILRAGHRVEVLEHTDQICRLRLIRADARPVHPFYEYTLADAAGLDLLQHWWWRNPFNMLWWRAIGRLGKMGAPECLLGFTQTMEELAENAGRGAAEGADDDVVEPAVQEFLSTLEDLAYSQVRDAWMKVRPEMSGKAGGTIDGRPYTVDQVVAVLLDRARQAEAPVSDDLAVAALSHVRKPVDPVADEPAGAGTLACGCSVSVVLLAGGAHPAGCAAEAFEDAWKPLHTLQPVAGYDQ